MMMDAVDAYLEVRRAVGFELVVPEYLLRSFARFATEKGQTHIKSQTAIEWASHAPSMNQRFHRLATLIRFADHVQVEDPGHEVPPRHIFGRKRKRLIPFIFTAEESDQLLLAASQLGPLNSIRPHTYSMLFGLLLVTGLRISEALALTLEDITRDGLVIRKTKFKKSRIIPLHETTRAGLERYLAHRLGFLPLDHHVFISSRGKGLGHSGVTWTFRNILIKTGMDPLPNRRRPRIHDLRHTFACRSLESCLEDPESVDRHIRALSTYMGHTSVSDTYWYLTATPNLMQSIADACELFRHGADS